MPDPAGQFELACKGLTDLDPLLQHQVRMGICVLLSTVDRMNFSRLSKTLKATDGNLGAQLHKLEEARYITCRKRFVNRKPVSWYSLTPGGRRATERHLSAMELVINSAKPER